MKTKRWMVVAALVLAGATMVQAEDGAATFARLRKLEGTWTAKAPNGQSVDTVITVTSAGSALMMTQPDGTAGGGMVTMIHRDGNRVMLTHYCSAKNQPRMVAAMAPNGKSIKFDFLDATNVEPGQPGMMKGVVFDLPDDDHMAQTWTFQGADGKMLTDTFKMERKK